MKVHYYLACDLGAESGRVILGKLAREKLSVQEIYRFSNRPVIINGSLRWNILNILSELQKGLEQAGKLGHPITSLSTDSWGVDYVYLTQNDSLLAAPYHYRDRRTDEVYRDAFRVLSAQEIFHETGIQFMNINTLYQLFLDQKDRKQIIHSADCFLLIGDYFNYLFSGLARAEVSLASTTQIYNPAKKSWSQKLIRRFKFPKKIFPKLVLSGTVLGSLKPQPFSGKEFKNTKVIATCSHDTAAAVVAVPAEGRNWAYLSSGTWSLLGIELPKPIINKKSLECNFTNEIGFGNTTRYLKNIVGLWIFQECRRTWASEGKNFSYDELTELAQRAMPLRSFIYPRDKRFLKSGEMPQKIRDYCLATKQKIPSSYGEIVRCILESLALLYRQTLEEIEYTTGYRVDQLHIVGGGSQNRLLNQFASNATGIGVIAGPAEATATGNILIQAMALKHLSSLQELRSVVRKSFRVEMYKPQNVAEWKMAFERFEKLDLKLKKS